MSVSKDIKLLIESETDDFLELLRIVGFDPRTDLRGADLANLDLRGADLSGADLVESDLTGASLEEADLENANLMRSKLRNAQFRDARLKGANLEQSEIDGVDFRGADLRHANLSIRSASGVMFDDDIRLPARVKRHLERVGADLFPIVAKQKVYVRTPSIASGGSVSFGLSRLRPLHDRVLVRRIEAEETTVGGIIIPDAAKEKPMEGEILAAGAGARDDDGKIHPLDVKKGDRILFGKYSGTEVTVEGDELIILKESDIMGVIETVKGEKVIKGKKGEKVA